MKQRTVSLVASLTGAVGVLIGLLVGHEVAADWLEAVGVWVGSLGTVGAIVWAVHSFRIEQALQRARAAEHTRQLLVGEYRRAGLVTCDARIGGSHGTNGRPTMTVGEVMARVTNSSDAAALHTRVEFIGLDVATAEPINIQPHSSHDYQLRVRGLEVTVEEAHGHVSLSDKVRLRFVMEGVTWERTGTADPTIVAVE